MKQHNGLTLIELLFTVAIVGVLLTVAIPSFSSIVKENKQISAINHVISLSRLARTEAVKRGLPVDLCRSINTTSCSNSGSLLNVIIDNNNDGDYSDTSDILLKSISMSDEYHGVTFYFQNIDNDKISYDAVGTSNTSGSIEVCLNDMTAKDSAKVVYFNRGGQLRSNISAAERAGVKCT